MRLSPHHQLINLATLQCEEILVILHLRLYCSLWRTTSHCIRPRGTPKSLDLCLPPRPTIVIGIVSSPILKPWKLLLPLTQSTDPHIRRTLFWAFRAVTVAPRHPSMTA